VIPQPLQDALEEVEYTLRFAAVGYLPGAHRGGFEGSSGKLVGYTSLVRRMDPKNIDPVATRRALSPTPLVRVYRARVATTVTVLLDLTASMGFVGVRSKVQEMSRLVACLGYSAYRLGDRFSVIGFGEDVELYLPPQRSPTLPLEVAQHLWAAGLRARHPGGLRKALELLPRARSLVFFTSDFHLERGLIEEAFARLRRHDGIAVVLWDRAEEELPTGGWIRLHDPERGRERSLWLRARLSRRIREAFRERERVILDLCARFDITPLVLRDGVEPRRIARLFLERHTPGGW
jgi:uncharacterized protein (DUF58 family)